MPVKISALPSATALTGAETVPLVQSSTTSRTLLSTIAAWITATYTGFLQAGTGAIAITIRAALRLYALTPQQFGATGDGVTDDTAAIVLWEAAARAAGKPMYASAGTYLCSNWNFGSNAVAAQSTAAPILFGDGSDTIFKAKSGTVGTLISAKNISGVILRDFTIDCDTKAVTGLDTSWYAVGPSLWNQYSNLLIQNYNGGPGWIATNNNDCDFNNNHVRLPQGGATIAISLKASGGLVHMQGCIWSDAYLHLGAQTYTLDGCWGSGIQYATGCVNAGVINGGYIYSNATTGANFASEALTSGTKIESLVLNGTWIDVVTGRTVFKTRAAGKIILNACTIVPVSGTPQLINASAVTDVGTVFIEFNGGRAEAGGTLGTTYPTGYVVVKNNFNNNGTVENTTSGAFTPALKFGGVAVGLTTSNATGRYSVYAGFCFFELLIVLTAKGSSTGNATITGLPFTSNATAPDHILPTLYQTVTYAAGSPISFIGTAASTITPYYQASAAGLVQLTDAGFANNSEIRISGFYAL